jgi:hypothetical protein
MKAIVSPDAGPRRPVSLVLDLDGGHLPLEEGHVD